MENVHDLLTNFRLITPQDTPTMFEYFTGFTKTRIWPRYYMSTMWLGSKSEFRWAVVDGCLCILKTKVLYGHPVIYLILPPMHLHGNVDVERRVLRRFYKSGVGAKLSNTDISLYGLTGKVEEDKGNAEYIYRAGNYNDLSGGTNKHWRRMSRELKTHCKVQLCDHTMARFKRQCVIIDTVWGQKRKAPISHGTKLVTAFEEYAAVGKCFGYLATRNDIPFAYGLSQATAPRWVSLLVRHHDYGDSLPDIGMGQHFINARYWADKCGADCLLNSGAAVRGPGLRASKNRMRPVHIQQLYTLKPKTTITLEDYSTITQSWKQSVIVGGFGF